MKLSPEELKTLKNATKAKTISLHIVGLNTEKIIMSTDPVFKDTTVEFDMVEQSGGKWKTFAIGDIYEFDLKTGEATNQLVLQKADPKKVGNNCMHSGYPEY